MTTDDIIKSLEEKIEKAIPMSPNWYLEQAQNLTVLMGDETDKLYALQRQVAQKKVILIQDGKSVAESKVTLEASDEYEKMLQQKAKVERIIEIIRISKIQARMKDTEMRLQ